MPSDAANAATRVPGVRATVDCGVRSALSPFDTCQAMGSSIDQFVHLSWSQSMEFL